MRMDEVVQQQKMMSAVAARYEETARVWDERGRPELPADPWSAMLLSCWMHSAGGRKDGASERLKAYGAELQRATETKNPDWLDDLFNEREHCTYCGQSWRAENCRYCTGCSRAYPPCCDDKRNLARLANGNLECSACRNGELVG